jgi:hypothetical protein
MKTQIGEMLIPQPAISRKKNEDKENVKTCYKE